MLDSRLLDEIISEYTIDELRHQLLHFELTTDQLAYCMAAIYYLEGTDND